MSRWFIWLMFVGYVNTENIILKDEYNSTSISEWNLSGDCTGNQWEWLKNYTRWSTCVYSDVSGSCNLETYYWPTLEANIIYVNLALGLHCPDFFTCDSSIKVYVFNEITNDYRFLTKSPTEESDYDYSRTLYTHTFKITNFTDRIKLKFETRRYCGFIKYISVYFKKCDQVAAGLATFDTVSAPNDTNVLIHTGQCVSNAEKTFKDGPFRTCFGNGSSILKSGCTCMKGFRQLNQTCVVDDTSSSVPVKNIVVGLVIGISAAIVVVMVAVYRFKKKPIGRRDVEIPSSERLNNNNPEQYMEISQEAIYETVCETTKETRLHREINGETKNCFDVFICYSANDREWVKNTLLKELESRGKKACIDYRDFLVGAHICENITDAIYGSRKTIAVLSPDFLNSVYCKQELHQALSRMAGHQVIPVLYRACGVPDGLKHKTYLEWCHDDVKPYFWQQLIKAIDNTSNTNNKLRLYEQC